MPSAKASIKVVEQYTWGTDGIVKRGFDQNSTETNTFEWEMGWHSYHLKHTGSNVYNHKVTVYNAETGEELASATVATPYQ